MRVAATMVGMFNFLQKGKSWLEKSQIGKRRKDIDEQPATNPSF